MHRFLMYHKESKQCSVAYTPGNYCIYYLIIYGTIAPAYIEIGLV